MKKSISLILAFVCVLALAACGAKSGGASPSPSLTPSASPAASGGGSLNVQNRLTQVEITLPASMFKGQAADQVISAAKAKGIDQVKTNADGSYTYVISKKQHSELLAEMKKSLVDMINKVKGDVSSANIKNIEYNSDFTAFTVYVDPSANQTLYGLSIFGIALADMYYQLFNGVKSDNIHIVFTVKNADTNAVIKTVTYPDALKNK